MGRTFSTDCIILRKYRVGEIHKGLVLLSESRGMLSAIAHGALRPGSRLSSGTEPLTLARVFFYRDPVKDSCKVTDLVLIAGFEHIKADVLRFFTASLWVEVVLRSLGGGVTDASVFHLLRSSLEGLDASEDKALDQADVQFLWRFLELAGFRPDIEHCSSCTRAVPEEEPMLHVSGSRALVCASCAALASASCLEMSPGARRYLAHSLWLAPSLAARVLLARPAARSLRRLSVGLVRDILEEPLKTLEAGAGIL